MKKLLTLVALILLSISINAQNNPPKGFGPKVTKITHDQKLTVFMVETDNEEIAKKILIEKGYLEYGVLGVFELKIKKTIVAGPKHAPYVFVYATKE